MIRFIKGEGITKGIRHIEMRMWYTRLQYKMKRMELYHMAGDILPADKLTKLGNRTSHQMFMRDILGLNLINVTETRSESF
jgi:hypothetical protein